MKEKIYTIPVNDAFSLECDCPICELERKTTQDLLNYFLGPSMMESDVRVVTNEKGFCKTHISEMFNRQENRLGMGLMLHTNLVETNNQLKKILKTASSQGSGLPFFSKKGDYKQKLIDGAKKIEAKTKSCALCDRLNYTMDRYIDVILWQFFEDKTFKEKFDNTKGFCMPHVAMLMRGCAKYLTSSKAYAFMEKLSQKHLDSLDELEKDIKWFTEKFDYKNQEKPWGNSKNSIARTINKSVGRVDLK